MIEQCMNMMSGGMMGGMMLPMLLGVLLVGVLVVAGIVLLVRHLSSGGTGTNSRALNILQERYARGELDHEDYQERRRLLETRP
jgi:putative membrane protein